MNTLFTRFILPHDAGSSGLRDAGRALLLFGAALALLVTVAGVLGRIPYLGGGPLGILLTEVCAILLPTLLWGAGLRGGAGASSTRWEALALRPASAAELARLVLCGLALGAAWFYVAAVLVEPLFLRICPMPPGEQEQLRRLLAPSTGLRPLALDLLAFAAAPALCEEMLFRGALQPTLQRGLAARLSPRAAAGAALVGTALLFGVYHISPPKLLPTAFLGLGFGAARLFTGSLWPAVAMHLCNNTLVILLVRSGRDDPPAPTWPWLLLVAAAAALGAGLGAVPHISRMKRNR